jgi:hypothetical protein
MRARFHVTGTGVKMIDVDPQYQAVANHTNIEFTLWGHLMEGDVFPGMLVNIRPHLRRGKYYRVMSLNKYDPPSELLEAIKLPEPLKKELLVSDEFSKTKYSLLLICADRNEFEELIKMNIEDEDIELFEDLE